VPLSVLLLSVFFTDKMKWYVRKGVGEEHQHRPKAGLCVFAPLREMHFVIGREGSTSPAKASA
jgi:hypothetical protein